MASQKGKCDQTREEEPIYVVELRTVLNVNSMRIESLMCRRLQWFGDLEKMRERVLGLVNVEPSTLVVVTQGEDPVKHGMK